MAITEWSEEDRPREKMMEHGPNALSKAELLAILVGSGTPKVSAVELMRNVLNSCDNSLHRLEHQSVEQLQKFNGVGPAKAVTILAACALAHRYAEENVDRGETVDAPEKIAAYFKPRIGHLPYEECHIMLLDNSLHLLGSNMVGSGGLTGTLVDVRKVMKEAVLRDAAALALCHNHPSGSLTPSPQDDDLTNRIRTACNTLSIRMIDHVIVTTQGYYSYTENNR